MAHSADVVASRHLVTPDRFAAWLDPGYRRPRHVRYVGARIAQTVARGGGRLLVTQPPQTGKTLLTTRYTIEWFLATTFGRGRALVVSYEAEYAAERGREIRNDIAAHDDRIGVHLRADSTAAHRFDLMEGGSVRTAGIDGSITGRSIELAVVDDPFKNWEDAQSPAKRRRVWNAWTATIRPRLQPEVRAPDGRVLMPAGSAIVVMTRWHEEDLGGLLEADLGEQWEVIRLPALAEPDDDEWEDEPDGGRRLVTAASLDEWRDRIGRRYGEALDPDRYDEDYYHATRLTVGERQFAGLYQQRPAPAEGEVFKREAWRFADAVPVDAALVRRWDMAATEGGGDWTVGLLEGRAPDGRVYVVDVVRRQVGPAEKQALIAGVAATDRERWGEGRVRIRIEQEPGSSGKDVAHLYVSQVLAGYPVRFLPSTGSKETRAELFAAQQGIGNVYLVRDPGGGRPDWWAPFLDECALFPNGAFDDQVDTASLAYMDLVRGVARPGRATSAAKRAAPAAPARPGPPVPGRVPRGRGRRPR
jgi:predicted phage terminase large subunit-like protein